jgi:hypothetical protein
MAVPQEIGEHIEGPGADINGRAPMAQSVEIEIQFELTESIGGHVELTDFVERFQDHSKRIASNIDPKFRVVKDEYSLGRTFL